MAMEQNKEKRGLDATFMGDLLSGSLSRCLACVKADKRLQLEIRGNYINIYYLGANVYQISANKRENQRSYRFSFDERYTKDDDAFLARLGKVRKDFPRVSDARGCEAYMELVPKILAHIDSYHGKVREKPEKYIQQGLLETCPLEDYLITDFEYQKGKHARFDLLGIKIRGNPAMLSFIEIKQGYSSLRTALKEKPDKYSSGLKKHLGDIVAELTKESEAGPFSNIDVEIRQACELFAQKQALGLLPRGEFPGGITNQEVEVLFLMVNYREKNKGTSENFKNEIDEINEWIKTIDTPFKVHVNFMFATTNQNYHLINMSRCAGLSECVALLHEYCGDPNHQFEPPPARLHK